MPKPSHADPAPTSTPSSPLPPVTARKPKRMTKHGETRVDPYYWLRERDNPEVLAHLRAENAYTEAVLQPTQALQKTLFEEMKGRLPPNDASVPVRQDAYYYYSRYVEGKEYPLFVRVPATPFGGPEFPVPGGPGEEILVDVNELAAGHSFFEIGSFALSHSHRYLAYAYDTVGKGIYTIKIKDLKTRQTLPDTLEGTAGRATWAMDDANLFYTRLDAETLREDRVFRHALGVGAAADPLVYAEPDEKFNVSIGRTLTRRYLVISSASKTSTEVRLIPADQPQAAPTIVEPRRPGHEYDIEDGGDRFYIHTNLNAKNFRIAAVAKDPSTGLPIAGGRRQWRPVVAHRANTLIEGLVVLARHLALQTRRNGLSLIEIRDRAAPAKNRRELKFSDPTYLAEIGDHREYDTPYLRYTYESMTTPYSVIDYDLATGKTIVRKRQVIPSGYDPTQYESKREFARSPDGTRVPISIVYRKSTAQAAKRPLLAYAYGSYGISTDPSFSSTIVSLLDRGFTFAIIHARGGSEMGRAWYENGKLRKKQNTFSDFIAGTRQLIRKKYGTPGHVYAMGGSAGGLLIGAVINQAPELYRGVVAQVPFVDVMTTMLDASLPLTTDEYEEWGNPNDRSFYRVMRRYSPYDNVKPQAYPEVLVTTGLHDSRVQYWEPAKWVARLRDFNQGPSRILLWTELEAGHGGKSGRFEGLREVALEYGFLLKLEHLSGDGN